MKGRRRGWSKQGQFEVESSRPPEQWPQCPICRERLSPERLDAHHARCLDRRGNPAPQAPQQSLAKPKDRPRTSLIDCPLCRRRVWREPDGTGGFRLLESRRGRTKEPHLCDGAPPDKRRGKLIYTDAETAITRRVGRSSKSSLEGRQSVR